MEGEAAGEVVNGEPIDQAEEEEEDLETLEPASCVRRKVIQHGGVVHILLLWKSEGDWQAWAFAKHVPVP